MISIVAAMDKNRVIGAKDEIPWKLPADLKYFRDLTINHTVVMGRKTFESIGKALPRRMNIVISRNRDFHAPRCIVVDSLEKALALTWEEEEVFFIGGGEIYRQIISRAERLYVTLIDAEFSGSVFFPAIDPVLWKKVKEEQGVRDKKNPYDYKFVVYERN